MPKKGTGWYPQQFREMAVERSRTCMHLGRLCKELGIDLHTLRTWRKKMGTKREEPPPGMGAETALEENRRLKRTLAEKVLEVDFFKGALQKVEARRRQNASNGAKVSTTRSGSDAVARQLKYRTDVPYRGDFDFGYVSPRILGLSFKTAIPQRRLPPLCERSE